MGPDARVDVDGVVLPPAKKAKRGGRWKKEVDDTPRVAFASADKAPQLSLSSDRLTVTGTTAGGGGYRMARASHGAVSYTHLRAHET